ncbi:carotenoid biosynthesis protein [Exiguobacterium sp. s144]|uniref:carotenoid biosynthesis protein n=1 Tax=Exiguobacterium sp. s144 TaxID=2751195 RepID=UPI001BE55FC4|nr:carotenoid biosynthesis protein [Exiguobacterium sp. s144]
MEQFHKRLWLFFSIWFTIGLILVGFSLLPPWLEWANAVFLFASGLYAALYFWHILPKGRLVIPFIFFGSIIIESIGVHTGWPFGTYRYESDFGVQLLGVPITIGAAWLSIMGASLAFSRLFSFRYSTLILVPLFAVWLDLAIDPVAANVKSYWLWQDGGWYYDIPTQNFFGWYGTALVFSFFINRYQVKATDDALEQNNQYLFLMLHTLFGVTAGVAGLYGVTLVSLSAFIVYFIVKRGVIVERSKQKQIS